MINKRLFTMTVTANHDRYKPRHIWIGHGGHGGHGVFTYIRARARKLPNYCITLTNVCKNTMTTMTTMTRLVNIRAVAGHGVGHSKNHHDQTKITTKTNAEGSVC